MRNLSNFRGFVSGTEVAQALGKIGVINEIGGSFMATLSAGITVYWMGQLGLPVSTSQIIIGSIIGWNMFSDSYTDLSSLFKILSLCGGSSPPALGYHRGPAVNPHQEFHPQNRYGMICLGGYTGFTLILAGVVGS